MTTDPIRIDVDGRPWWLFADGTRLPVVAGAADDPPDPKADPPDPKADPPAAPDPTALAALPEWAREEIAKTRREAAAYRTKAKELEPLAAKAKELEDAGKSDTEKLTGKLADVERARTDAEARALRLEVALEKGLTASQAKRLVGGTKEELAADADELLASFKPADGNGGKPTGRPHERLRGGGDPTTSPDETDPRKLAAQVPRTS